MKRLATLLASLICCTIAIYADDADNNIYLRMIDDAENAIKSRDFAKAETLMTQAISFQPDNPNNALIMSNLGMVRFYMDNDSLAILTLNQAHTMAPSSVTILLNRARVLSATGNITAALDDYNRVTQLDSAVVMPYLFRGLLHLGNKDISAAKAQFDIISALAPHSYEEALALSNFYFFQQQYAEAKPYFSRLLETEKTPENYASHAICALFTDDLDTASEDIAAGLSLNQNYGELYLCRALLYKRRYRNEDALRDAQTAKTLGVDADTVDSLMNLK